MKYIKYIKTYEKKEKIKKIELVGYPQGNIISVTLEELDELKHVEDPETEDFLIEWDWDGHQWGFRNDNEEQLEEWLRCYRDPIYRDAKKYNL